MTMYGVCTKHCDKLTEYSMFLIIKFYKNQMRCHIVQFVKAKDADLQGKSQDIINTLIHKTFRESMGSLFVHCNI